MSNSGDNRELIEKIRSLESRISELKFELDETRSILEEQQQQRRFYQLIAEFAFAWELWFDPGGNIKYCSPSCYDLTGFTSNEIILAPGIEPLLVYEVDKTKFNDFLQGSLKQSLVNQSLEFRILTRTKQLRWCVLNVRGVYDQHGKYLGVRASVHDISRLKRAMGHISELEKGKEFEQRNKQRLQNQLELKDRELVSFLLQLSQKNELLTKAENMLKQGGFTSAVQQKKLLEQLSALFDQHEPVIEWGMIGNQLEKIHPGFLDRLQKRHPAISSKDVRLCTYIRLGLSSKEIAGLINNTPKSVEIARVRLRKKLKITGNSRLSAYLSQV